MRFAIELVRQARSRTGRAHRSVGCFFGSRDAALEARALLSTLPVWVEQGPMPVQGSQRLDVPYGLISGAVQSIAINPSNPAQIFVATVNGGVWRTDNANSQNPNATRWTPLTDSLPSLAMGDLAFSPLDPNFNTLFAGTGSFSSGGPVSDNAGGPPIGVLRTIDGGSNWQVFPLDPGGTEHRVKVVLPTSLRVQTPMGERPMVLAGTVLGGGLYRSDDNGETWELLSGRAGLPRGDVTSLVVDPNNSNRFYAGIAVSSDSQGGVYRGEFDPATQLFSWSRMSPDLTLQAANVQIAAGKGTASTVVYTMISGPSSGGESGKEVEAFQSSDGGLSWTRLPRPPSIFRADFVNRSGNVLLVDPTDSGILYAATYGEAERDEPGGERDGEKEDEEPEFDVFVFHENTSSWQPLADVPNPSNPAVNNGAPHVDSRDLAFSGTATLFLSSDGGIYALANPRDPGAGQWVAYTGFNGTGLGNLENHNAAWDPLSDTIIVGAQDNGVSYQPSRDALLWESLLGADGGEVAVDPVSLASSEQSIRYASSQRLGAFARYVFDNRGNLASVLPLGIPGANQFAPQFITPIAVNAGASRHVAGLVIGGGAQGNGPGAVFQANNAATATAASPAVWRRVPIARPGMVQGSVNAMVFGGSRGNARRPGILYVGYDSGDLLLRVHDGGALRKTSPLPVRAPIIDVAANPSDWRHVFVATPTRVFESRNAGRSWSDLTGSLGNPNLRAITYIDSGASGALLVGGLGGVFRADANHPGRWTEFGANLPNAVVYDLDYDASDDVLVAAAFGRGTWIARDVRQSVGTADTTADEAMAGRSAAPRLAVAFRQSQARRVVRG